MEHTMTDSGMICLSSYILGIFLIKTNLLWLKLGLRSRSTLGVLHSEGLVAEQYLWLHIPHSVNNKH